jgi:ferrous iron transport protein B
LLEAQEKLQNSYAGHLGKVIEPVIRPLGFDWKIGIALISSFAAREVFVGSMSTIYSVGGGEDNIAGLQNKLMNEIDPKTGKPIMTMPIAFSLLIFYVFAMQCMSTLAIIKRETNSWKWPLIAFGYLTANCLFR